eukprot:CAMPEP_0180381658 /NCGR_PEP_ID=MMETSP0989-20121125/26877_1 /TAXON_ID=697907 /ORGANISM="non described non described, Strain CCMP2293" /LENGTH=322 /DNA_ID=CAMNT_0022381577 /DNA_START=1 /DNA_END=969 /DNA_ORIENTATION=+
MTGIMQYFPGWGGVGPAVFLPLLGFALFFLELLAIVIPEAGMFLRKYGRRHRLTGLLHLIFLIFGIFNILLDIIPPLAYDVTLSLLGTALALSAAFDFRTAHSKQRVKNPASGALEDTTIVTFDEMLEHSFYQGLNVVQVLFLHLTPLLSTSPLLRAAAALLATSPWLLRGYFPVHSFSANYSKQGQDPRTLVAILYRLKKYQYLLYKHVLLHGLNASVAVRATALGSRHSFRLYWLALNTAYVMEFFLQSLVRKGALSQGRMLRMNQALMLVSTAAALQVVVEVVPAAAVASLLLNLVHRHHEMVNFCVVLCVTFAVTGVR